MCQATTVPPLLPVTAYSLQRRPDNTWSLVTLTVKGDAVASRRETEPDTRSAVEGMLMRRVRETM